MHSPLAISLCGVPSKLRLVVWKRGVIPCVHQDTITMSVSSSSALTGMFAHFCVLSDHVSLDICLTLTLKPPSDVKDRFCFSNFFFPRSASSFDQMRIW